MAKLSAVFCFVVVLALAVVVTSNYCSGSCGGGCCGPTCVETNWKQCSWKNVNSGANNALILACPFYKKSPNSYLRVAFSGNMRQYLANKCSRWYFTFNGKECAHPHPIDAVIYQSSSNNLLRAGQFEGYCGFINRGLVNVELRTGLCQSHNTGHPYTGWQSYSRIMIEEVNQPQP